MKIVFLEEFYSKFLNYIFKDTYSPDMTGKTGYQTIEYSIITRVSAKRFSIEVARIAKTNKKITKQIP